MCHAHRIEFLTLPRITCMKTIAKLLTAGEGSFPGRWRKRWNLSPRGKGWGLGAFLLLTLLWGSTFVVVKDTVVEVSPSILLSVRFLLSAILLTPLLRRRSRVQTTVQTTWNWALGWAGLELGLALFAGYMTQTIGLQYTTVYRSAFVTALNVFFVPLFLGLLGHRLGWPIWLASLLALGGVGLLSYDGSPPNLGDLWTLGTAIAYAVYIIRLGYYTQRYSALSLSVAQLWVTTIASVMWAIATDFKALMPEQLMRLPWGPLLYLAIACTAGTTLLQAWGQQRVNAVQSSILFTLEPVWASVFAYLLLGETLGTQGLLGAAAIVGATLLTAVPNVAGPSAHCG